MKLSGSHLQPPRAQPVSWQWKQVAKLFENVSTNIQHISTLLTFQKNLRGGQRKLGLQVFFRNSANSRSVGQAGSPAITGPILSGKGCNLQGEMCIVGGAVLDLHGCIIAVVLWMQYNENTSNFILDVAAPVLEPS